MISVHAGSLNVYYDGTETTVWKQVGGYDTTSSVFLLLIFVSALIAWVLPPIRLHQRNPL